MSATPLTWTLTIAALIVLVLFDLLIHRNDKSPRDALIEAAWASGIWTALGLGFTAIIALVENGSSAGQYVTGYVLERMLSIDNVFVFVLILDAFAIPAKKHHSALLWGSIMALVLRAIFIVVGAALLETFSWTIYIFGAILIYTAVNLLRENERTEGDSKVVRFSRKLKNPMMAVFVALGITDVVFAVDSIPAVFAVTHQTYLVFSANAFAVLGLRPLATILAGVMHRFVYLKPGLAIVLALIGIKMLLEHLVSIPTWISLVAIVVIMSGAIGASMKRTAR
jgi:tellurite resistance protein TerC